MLVILFGNRAWWLYLVVPGYSVYLAATTVGEMKGMLGGAAQGTGADGTGVAPEAESKRQKKMEKRGGQRVAYR